MRSSAAIGRLVSLLLATIVTAAPLPARQAPAYRTAMPGYKFEFPRDHFDHPDFRTEWWYYTGNLRAADGRRFGFELTFFRQAVSREPAASPWTVRDVYLAHFAVSDIDGRAFHHDERMNRAGPGLAGASARAGRIWNGNWQVRWEGDAQVLEATGEGFSIRLGLNPTKGPVIHGRDGVSQKAAGPGRGSHYVSFTRLKASGVVELEGTRHAVSGLAWMDHEFFTHQLEPEQTGWDWFSLQLDDGSELMLFQLRRKDGAVDPFSAGTYVDLEGRSRHLAMSDFALEPGSRRWRSPSTGGAYPVTWRISVRPLGITLEVSTPLEQQEIVSRTDIAPSYWEGAIEVTGRRAGRPIGGVGYLEMTGYDKEVRIDR